MGDGNYGGSNRYYDSGGGGGGDGIPGKGRVRKGDGRTQDHWEADSEAEPKLAYKVLGNCQNPRPANLISRQT